MEASTAKTKRKGSPFSLPPDAEAQKNALMTALQIAQGFALYFVVSDPARVRPRLMDEIEQRLPDKRIQRVAVTTETRNLLHLLQEQLETPLPDAVFVYGLENWISGAVNPRSIPFILNLNAARNNFYELVRCPLVFWVPLHVMNAIINGAPDFFSVRSGAYTLPLTSEERAELNRTLATRGWIETRGLRPAEMDAEIHKAESLLSEYRALPAAERNLLDEAHLLNALAGLYISHGRYGDAEPLCCEALKILRECLPADHLFISGGMNNLASVYRSQGRYAEAEPLCREALEIRRAALPAGHPLIAQSLNNLALVYRSQGRYAEAEPLYQEALAIDREVLPVGHSDIASDMNNLASLYHSQNRFAEAEPLLQEALNRFRENLGDDHPTTQIVADNYLIFLADREKQKQKEIIESPARVGGAGVEIEAEGPDSIQITRRSSLRRQKEIV